MWKKSTGTVTQVRPNLIEEEKKKKKKKKKALKKKKLPSKGDSDDNESNW